MNHTHPVSESLSAPVTRGAGGDLHRALSLLVGTERWRLRLWDGSEHGSAEPCFTLSVHARRALDRLVGGTPERGFGRAYVEGTLDVEPLEALFEARPPLGAGRTVRALPALVRAALTLGARPDPRRAIAEARLHGLRHSATRDAAAISHHYDLPPAFYGLFLGATMTYSCAYFTEADADIDTAQRAKLDLVCRKLRLQPGEHLLDVGCGFGSLVMHAAEHHGVRATGITLSRTQAEWAQQRIAERGLGRRATVRLADYRDDLGGPYDAVASVGMVEHVGRAPMGRFCRALHGAVREGGRVLVHGITSWPGDSGRSPFINAFVFPDGRIPELGFLVTSLQDAHLEVRDVDGLREHYALTIDRWLARLGDHRADAVALAGEERTRLWRLYLTACRAAFRRARVGLHQILALRTGDSGDSGLPLTRADWYGAGEASTRPL